MSDYDAAFAAAVGGTNSADPYDAAFADAVGGLQRLPASAPQKKYVGTGSATLDAGNAVGTGYWRGIARLAGIPVDTVANVLDLGKAAIGAPYIAATGKAPPSWLEVGDRSQVVGSGDNIINSARKTGLGRTMLDAANPEYQGGYLQTAGTGLTAVMSPTSAAQGVNQAVLGVGGNVAGKLAYDVTGDPALAIAASLVPQGAQQAVTAGTKYAVRGGEESRRKMEQRIQDLKNAGIENPTLALATGNKVLGGVENILQSTPGAVGIMGKARDAAINGLQAKAEEAAALASSNRGTLESGQAIQGGIKDFKDSFKGRQEQLYNKLDTFVPANYPTNVGQMRSTLQSLNADIPGAPALSKFFKNEKILSLERALESDTTPGGGGGKPGIQLNTLPFEAVKKTRTLVGNELADNSLLSQVPQSKWRSLYGGISQDIGDTAQAAGPQAAQAFNRANAYTRSGMARLERVAPFAQAVAPEQAFTAMERAARENVSTLQAVKKTLPPDARGTVAGTIIERLGTANPGQQNATGTAWSPETFLTNWNKMTPKARDEMFSGFKNSAEVRANVDSVAQAASMMRDSSKMWANPSGTGANTAARAALGAIGIGGGASLAGLLNPWVPAGAAVGMLGANRLAAAMTSPEVVAAMARRGYVSPGLLSGQYRALVGSGLLSQEQPGQ